MKNEGVEADIAEQCDAIKTMLVEKNRAYGNSALDPVRVFSRADTAEQIRVRIDDKLSRLQRGRTFGDEDTVLDLIGYLILLRVAVKRSDEPATHAFPPHRPVIFEDLNGKELDTVGAELGIQRRTRQGVPEKDEDYRCRLRAGNTADDENRGGQ